MTKEEAKQAMIDGNLICHDYYSDHEYIFLNEIGDIQSEDGYSHGTFSDEFWEIHQKWQSGWSIFKNK